MDVSIKDFTINMDVKANGIEFEVREPKGGQFLGDCYVAMAGLVWCNGKTGRDNGTKVSWADFIEIMKSETKLKAAVKAAKKA